MIARLTFLFLLQATLAGPTLTTDDQDLRKFEPLARAAARAPDRRALLALIDLPLRVNRGGRTVRTHYYRTRKSVERDFSRIFPPKILETLRTGPYVSSGTGKGMVGSGAIWFTRPCHTQVCNPEGPGPFRISVINLDN
jgi:hypothetical protein